VRNFPDIVEEILAHRWSTSPLTATADGIHTYDLELDRMDRDSLEEANTKRKEFLTALKSINASALTPIQSLECRVLKGVLETSIAEFEEARYWEKDPSIPASIALYSVFLLQLRRFAPIQDRASAILSRMEKIPRLLTEARKNFVNPPQVFTLIACDVVQGGVSFISDAIASLAEDVPSLKNPLLNARKNALYALGDYLSYLRKDLLPKSQGDISIGKDLFNLKLREEHGLPYNSREIKEIGEAALREAEEKIAGIANSIDKNKTWQGIFSEMKATHPGPHELLEAYRVEMERAREFIKARNLLDFPEDESLEVIPTPAFDRPTTPYAAIMPPAPFEKDQRSFFYVTPIEDSMPPQEREERLKGHCVYGIPITALHEAYPGHHLQFIFANRNPSKVFRLYGTPVLVEGWAFYCEEMMFEQGYYIDPRVRLYQLKDILWRASRVIVDVGLHTEGMSYNEAVQFLVTRAGLEEPNARNEVNRYCQGPTYPMSYLIGKHEIMAIRNEFSRMAGKGYSLRDFHKKLLGYGNISPCLIAKHEFQR